MVFRRSCEPRISSDALVTSCPISQRHSPRSQCTPHRTGSNENSTLKSKPILKRSILKYEMSNPTTPKSQDGIIMTQIDLPGLPQLLAWSLLTSSKSSRDQLFGFRAVQICLHPRSAKNHVGNVGLTCEHTCYDISAVVSYKSPSTPHTSAAHTLPTDPDGE